jgi:predicted nucleic acid-binding protein
MSTFLDANVLLELLLPGRAKTAAARQLVAHASGIVISPLTAHLYVHFGRKGGVSIHKLLQDVGRYNYTAFGVREITWAVANRQNDDFEDSLQVACAVLHGCARFVTLDAALAGKYRNLIDMKLL